MIQHDDTGKKQYEINKNVYKSDIAVLITGATTTRKDHVINIIPPPLFSLLSEENVVVYL